MKEIITQKWDIEIMYVYYKYMKIYFVVCLFITNMPHHFPTMDFT